MIVDLHLSEVGMDEPFFKASDGSYFEMARVTGNSTKSGRQQGSEILAPLEKVCPETFPNGLSMPVGWNLLSTLGLILNSYWCPDDAGRSWDCWRSLITSCSSKSLHWSYA